MQPRQLKGTCVVFHLSFNKFLPCAEERLKRSAVLSAVSAKNEHFPVKPLLSGSSSVHMLIARMCIAAADLRIRLDTSRGGYPLSADYCSALPTPSKGDTCASAGPAAFFSFFFFRGKCHSGERRSSGRRLRAAAQRLSSFSAVKLLCFLLSGSKNNTCADLFFHMIIPPRDTRPRALSQHDIRS